MEIERLIQSIERAPNDPLEIIEAARTALGLKYLSYVAVTFPKPKGQRLPIFTSNYPNEWLKHYVDQDYVSKDPVILETMKSIHPVDWTGLDQKSDVGKQLFGEAREFGIAATGLTMPVRGFRGELAVLSASSDFSRKTWEEYKSENLHKIEVASSLIHTRTLKVFDISDERPKLTPREIECLYWTSHGKSSADVAEILNISEETTRHYLKSSRNKLNCLTITHCVAKAISLRIIPPVY